MDKRKKQLPILGTGFLIVLFGLFAFSWLPQSESDFGKAKREVLLRQMGHQILLNAGDSLSRVLPVKHLSKNEYEIQFEKPFTFQADSLAQIIHQIVVENNLHLDYVVQVKTCLEEEVIFGYAMMGSERKSIIPCAGREQEEQCYSIHLNFRNEWSRGEVVTFSGMSILGILLLFGLLGFVTKKTNKESPKDFSAKGFDQQGISLGNSIFLPEKQYLIIAGERVELTLKESKLLELFASNPNQTIDRDQIQQKVWENEVILASRSQDVFVSKLRKKLKKDSSLKLLSVHGKGYKLVVEGRRFN